MSDTKRPNFLLFITDQMRADHVGYAGNKIVKTPNIDGLANTGSWWSKFYVGSPTCMSNRATLMTGRMPSLNGVRHNGIPLDLSSVTFVDLLRAAGYKTALLGKAHIQGITNAQSKFPRAFRPPHLAPPPAHLAEARRSVFSNKDYTNEMAEFWEKERTHEQIIPNPYYGFEKVRFCSGHGDAVSGHYANWLKEIGYTDGVGIENSLATGNTGAPQAYKPRMTEDVYPTSYVTQETIKTLDEFSTEDAPFFIQCSFPDPHHPFTPPGKYWDMFSPSDMELPRSFFEPNEDAIPPLRLLWDDFKNGVPSKRWTFPFVTGEQQAREILAKTFGQIAMIDDAIGSVLSHLARLNLTENTVICFMSDHGDYLGDHGLFLKGPINYQSIIRTPFVWRDPDPAYNRGAQHSLGSTLDISTTVLYRAGLEPANGMQGKDLFTELRDGTSSLIVELTTTSVPYLGFDEIISVTTLVKKEWRLSVWENQPWGELYDLLNDPDELVNLWDDPTYESKKSALLLTLIQSLQSNRDKSPHPLSIV